METKQKNTDKYMYIIQAALEYLIAILVSGSFLATLTNAIGISDSLTGILSSAISLGCLFQLLSIAVKPKNCKLFVIVMSIINQFLFLLLYLIPVTSIFAKYKILIFTAVIFSAYLIYYISHPKKINWLMSTVEDKERGIFTANKEIISLIAGAIFSYLAGALIDKFTLNNQSNTAFIICAFIIAVISLIHTVCLIKTTNTQAATTVEKQSFILKINGFAKNKKLLKVALILTLYYVALYCSPPFFGTYQIKDLDLSLKTISILNMLGSISRIAVSRKWGRYADKYSFSLMIKKCFYFLGAAFICASLSFPKTGIIAFAAYYIFHGIALGGTNSAIINLVYECTDKDSRADAFAICQATAGTIGFVSTVVAGFLVSRFQKSPDLFLAKYLSAPQILSFLSFILIVTAIIFTHKTLTPEKENKK